MSSFSKIIINRILWRAMSIREERDLWDLCNDALRSESSIRVNVNSYDDIIPFIRIAKCNTNASETHHIRKYIEYLKKLDKEHPYLRLEIPNSGQRFQYIVTDSDAYGSDDKGMAKHYVSVNNFFNEHFRKFLRVEKLGLNLQHYFVECIAGLTKLLYMHPRFNMQGSFTTETFQSKALFKTVCKKAIEKVKRLISNEMKDLFPNISAKHIKELKLKNLDDMIIGLNITPVMRIILSKCLVTRCNNIDNLVSAQIKRISGRQLYHCVRNVGKSHGEICLKLLRMKQDALANKIKEVWSDLCKMSCFNVGRRFTQEDVDTIEALLYDCASYRTLYYTWMHRALREREVLKQLIK